MGYGADYRGNMSAAKDDENYVVLRAENTKLQNDLAGAKFASDSHLRTVEAQHKLIGEQRACIAKLQATVCRLHAELAAAPAPILSGEVAELRKLAMAATPGPWELHHETDDECYHAGYSILAAGGKAISDDGTAPDDNDAQYIAAANPAAILRLLDALAAVPTMPAKPCAVFEGYVDGKPRIQWTGDALPVGTELFAAMPAQPDGYVLAPYYRGYANLGTGQYLLNHSRSGEVATLVISLATDEEKAGRVVGDERANPTSALLQPEAMAVRIDFTTVAGLDALENQLRKLRAEHFGPAMPAQVQQPSEAARLVCLEAAQKLRTYVGIYTGDKQARRLVDELSNIAAARVTPSPEAAQVQAGSVPGLSNAFVTLESNGGEGRNIVLKFNQRADAFAVHDFLLKAGSRDYAAPLPPVAPQALTDAEIDGGKHD